MHYEAVGYSLWRYICRIRKWWTKSQGWKMQDLENDGPGARCLPWSHQICFMPNFCYGVLFVIKKVLSGWHKRACIVKRAAEGGKLAYQRFQLTTNFYTFLSHLQNATVNSMAEAEWIQRGVEIRRQCPVYLADIVQLDGMASTRSGLRSAVVSTTSEYQSRRARLFIRRSGRLEPTTREHPPAANYIFQT